MVIDVFMRPGNVPPIRSDWAGVERVIVCGGFECGTMGPYIRAALDNGVKIEVPDPEVFRAVEHFISRNYTSN